MRNITLPVTGTPALLILSGGGISGTAQPSGVPFSSPTGLPNSHQFPNINTSGRTSPHQAGSTFRFSSFDLRISPSLLPVRHPNILHLHRMPQPPLPFALGSIEPVDRAPLIRKHLLQIPRRQRLRHHTLRIVAKTPQRIHVRMLG